MSPLMYHCPRCDWVDVSFSFRRPHCRKCGFKCPARSTTILSCVMCEVSLETEGQMCHKCRVGMA
jgi:hypothetical protein